MPKSMEAANHMTEEADSIRKVKKTVVVFDICSSTKIIEDVILNDHIDTWRDFLIVVKEYLQTNSADGFFTVYKFVGDGWILLFDSSQSIAKILDFLYRFGKWFEIEFKERIADILQQVPPVTGMTYGMDGGELVEFIMNGIVEYVGRPINVASRLQGATKFEDKSPQYKLLIQKHLYNRNKKAFSPYHSTPMQLSLSNILDGKPVDCMKMNLSMRAKPQSGRFHSVLRVPDHRPFPSGLATQIVEACTKEKDIFVDLKTIYAALPKFAKIEINNEIQRLLNAEVLFEVDGRYSLTHSQNPFGHRNARYS